MRDQLSDLKTHCILWYDDKIKCTYCEITNIERLTIHHKSYTPDSIVYINFGNSLTGRLSYYSALLDEIMDNPSNFETLCNRCHALLHLHNKNKVPPKDEGQKELSDN